MGPLSDRHVHWDGCVNVRDLGGLPLVEGGVTRHGAVVRTDDVNRLTASGWNALRAHGVRTIVDLRFAAERLDDPPPPARLRVAHVSLFGVHDLAEATRVDDLVRSAPDGIAATAALYADALATCSAQIASAVSAVAAASSDGGVVVHCYVGKDRTGIVAALLLDIAGVVHDAIVDDYALTEGRVGILVDHWVAAADSAAERNLRERISAAPAGAMAALLELLGAQYGGAWAYLRAAGVTEHELRRVRAHLRMT